ncbi:MAG: aldehyde dehydrogenase family protein [Rhodospirillaceae bacterium]|jgi:phenylacetaldehyde dehydrogenase|nr:aldehyde dehydrogenase family protein [Rhodospirillaceae bacterium]
MNVVLNEVAPQTEGAQSFLKTPAKNMLINGEWVEAQSGERLDSKDPATGAVNGTIPKGAKADVDAAVKAARDSFESGVWRNMTPDDRGRLLWKVSELVEANIDELAELETLDQGKPLFIGRWAEIPGAAQQFRYFAGMTSKIEGQTITSSINYQPEGKRMHAYTLKEPIGVVGAITPWNSPLVLEAMKIAPCLAAGCSMILKPAEATSLTAIRLGELIMEAGLPPGVFNVITGLGPEAGQALAEHMDVDKIAFTGSTATGKKIIDAAKGNMKKVALELGGKSPSVVMADAEMELAIPGAANAIFFNGGQVCVAGSRLYVEKKAFDNVVAGIADIAKSMQMGHGLDPATQIGPMVSKIQADRVKGFIDGGVSDGAEIVTGGEQLGDNGTFISPTVIANTRQDMAVVQEEIFGPVVVAAPIDSMDDVPAIANGSRYGLAASVWTQDISKATRLAADIKAGTVWINCHLMFDASLPIGGYKESGWSRDSGQQAVENYLETKTVCAVV